MVIVQAFHPAECLDDDPPTPAFGVAQQEGWCPVSGAVDPAEKTRQEFLARLAHEVQVRGLRCSLTGPDGALLQVSHPTSGRSTIVFAMPSSPDTWSYLWSGGGSASATSPAQAADLLATALDR
jgi:hypothetical protein